ncbi:MAG: DMT family transporter [Okeania sp. SIO2H7]|nr:DMT family transporter [Okeania sp. SIO2H7]
MTQQLELTSQPSAKNETSMALAALVADLVIIAFLPILLKVSELEISASATVFNRFWIATTIFSLLHGVSLVKKLRSRNPLPIKSPPYEGGFSTPTKSSPYEGGFSTPTKSSPYEGGFSTPIKSPPYEGGFGGIKLLLLMLGVFSGGQQLLYTWSLTQTTVANSEVLHSLTPLFTTLFGWTFLAQKFDRRFLIGIAIAIVGSIALAANDFSIALDKLQGDGLALASAALWGGYLMVTEKLRSQLSIMAIATWNCLLVTLFTLPFVLVTGEELFPHSQVSWLTLGVLGISAIFTKFLITYSLKRLSSGLVATILLLHPAITAILAWGFFSETLTWLNLLAFAVILFGAYLTTSSKGGVKKTED